MKITKKNLILLSGGLDSTITAFWLKKQGYILDALYIDYENGEKNGERESAITIAKKLNIFLSIIYTPLPSESLKKISSEIKNDIKLFGDLVNMLIIASEFALISDIDSIILGINLDDVRAYPALQNRFFQTLQKLISQWVDKKIYFLTPFINKDKVTIMRIGLKLGVPFKNTWSCSVNIDTHCGTCNNCLKRKKLFKELDLPDETEYNNKDFNLI